MLKKLATVIVTASIFMQAGVVYGSTTAFEDLQGYDWAVPAITAMADSGVISGIGNNKFAPANNVTRLEFANMAIRAVGGDIDKLAQEAGNLAEIEAENGNFWGNSIICAAQKLGLAHLGTDKANWNEPANRAEMAYIAITAAKEIKQEKFEYKNEVKSNIYDFEAVRNCSAAIPANYFGAILDAYSNGIVSGINAKGEFAPEKNATRAEATVIIWRLTDPSQRVEVKLIEPIKTSPSATGDNVMPDGMIYPKEGDIGRDGKPITRDPETGVLGYGNGQKGGIYLGLTYPNGRRIDVDSTALDDYDNMWGYYSRRKDYVYWGKEWTMIDNYVLKKLKEEHPANSNKIGLQADIEGNIIQPGSDAIAMYEIIDFAGFNMWNHLR